MVEATPQRLARSALLVRILTIKAYGLLLLYVLFATSRIARPVTVFVFQHPGEFRAGRIEAIESGFWERLAPFDGQWYLDIAGRGYRELSAIEVRPDLPPGNHAFFPLLPALLAGASAVTGDAALALVILAVIAASAAGTLACGSIAERVGARPWLTALLLLAFPAAVFQFALYTEGIFLLLSALALLAAMEKRAHAAGAAALLASLCRPQGILLALPLGIELVVPHLRGPRKDLRRAAQSAVICAGAAAGFLTQAAISLEVTGSPVAFLGVQSAWGRSCEAGGVLAAILGAFRYAGPPVDLIGLVLGLGLLVPMWRRLPRSLAAYGTAAVLMPLATGSILSLGRFVSVSIPHFLVLALLLQERPRLRAAAIAGFAACQILLARGLISWYFVG